MSIFIPESAVTLVKKLHPFHAKAFKSHVGWAVGHGHTRTTHEGDVVTEEQAEWLLRQDLMREADHVRDTVNVPLEEYQFAALIIFCAHIGKNFFEKSNLVSLLNRGWYDQVPAQIRRWGKNQRMVHRMRRDAEIKLWRGEMVEISEEREGVA